MKSTRRCLLMSLILAVTGIYGFGFPPVCPARESAPAADRPRLLVLVVFDQMRGDYLIRWEPHFGNGGFRRLQKEGAWYQNCHYPYAGTLTGAGHASLLTGCSPATHGIVGNDWFDRVRGASTNCVGSLKYERVPPFPASAGEISKKDRGKVSPELLKSASFGDVLKDATEDRGRIVALSFKDRSAILPAGRKPDACYWFDTETGTFVTSTYYNDRLHPWVEEFNRERAADRWFDKEWARFRTDLDYETLIGPDDVVGEGSGTKQGRTFPHPLNGGLEKPGSASYQAFYNSPFGNELLLSLAKRAIDAEKLGSDDDPDLLCISFSSNDAIGHTWGPDSQEVFDVTLRSDEIVQGLLSHLDAKVGKGHYLLALSADHGVCSIPEVAKAHGRDAGRVSSKALLSGANEFLEAEFGGGGTESPKWVDSMFNGWFLLNQARLRERSVPAAQAEFALAQWIRKQPGVFAAFTRTQLGRGISADDAQGQRVRRSFYPDRCGDVLLVLKPNWLLGDNTTGTTHGSPYGYDSHVPLLIYGPKIAAGARLERVSPTAIAAIFSRALGVKPPADADTPVPESLFATGLSP